MEVVKGFVKSKGCKLVNDEGKEILLRGVGLGGWLLPEGYMWHFPETGDRPRRMETMTKELLGDTKSQLFWKIYREHFVIEADIRQIKHAGFNSVRVPFNARLILESDDKRTYNEELVCLIDNVIKWCEKNRLYVILDMHGAPGGQTGTNIDDSMNNQPELFMNENNKQQTINLWKFLANRYKDEWIVAGYDLLNEPLPEWFSKYNNQVMPLYEEIIKAIRSVDKRHMIILEGVHWATDWSIFDKKLDENLMLQFHKYWNNPDTKSIQKYLDIRDEWSVPIFMGEGGENNIAWYTGVFPMLEEHNISWNFWTWKKMKTHNSPCSVKMPKDWSVLTDYLEGKAKPSSEKAEKILWTFLDNILFYNCDYHKEVVDSLFRRPPVQIPAIFYGYQGKGISFDIKRRGKENIGFRVEDGTSIRFIKSNKKTVNFQHGRGENWQNDERTCIKLEIGDWFTYNVNVIESSCFTINLHLQSDCKEGKLTIAVNGQTMKTVKINETPWKIITLLRDLQLKPGMHKISLKAEESSLSIEWLEVRPSYNCKS